MRPAFAPTILALIVAPLLGTACGSGPPGATEAQPPKINIAEDASVSHGPVELRTFDLVPTSTMALNGGLCDEFIVASLGGEAAALGQMLKIGRGQVLVARGFPTLDLSGNGRMLVALVKPEKCLAAPERTAKVHGGLELTWAKGAMYARLAVEGADAKQAYIGYLSGTAPVAEHVHESSWEVLYAEKASGTFTLRGVPKHLGAGETVFVPPNTPHSWTPDPGSTLEAIQMYVPPGPEQRFKALSALDDAGVRPTDAGASNLEAGVGPRDAGSKASAAGPRDAGPTDGKKAR